MVVAYFSYGGRPRRPHASSRRWPRDLHPFFRQNLPEGYLLGVIREEFGPLLDGTDLSLLAVVGAAGIGRLAFAAGMYRSTYSSRSR